MDRAFIHIGYPKAASTALQLGYFERHPELFYLGPSSGGNISAYHNVDVKNALEVDLRVMKDFGYDAVGTRKVFKSCYKAFMASGRKRFGFSSEGLSFTLHHDIDVTQKAERLLQIFGPTTKIIIVIRDQFSLLRSLYRNNVTVGYPGTFQQFVTEAFYNKGRSFIYDFDYYKMYSLYSTLFGKDRVLILPMENLQNDPMTFCDSISNHLGVLPVVRELDIKNESQSDAFYICMRELNADHRNYLNASVTQPVAQSRYLEYFSDTMNMPEPVKATYEAKLLDLLWTTAADATRGKDAKIDFSIPPFIETWLVDYYGRSNKMLSSATGLPLQDLGYPCAVAAPMGMPENRSLFSRLIARWGK